MGRPGFVNTSRATNEIYRSSTPANLSWVTVVINNIGKIKYVFCQFKLIEVMSALPWKL
jgi:hypothetical protein